MIDNPKIIFFFFQKKNTEFSNIMKEPECVAKSQERIHKWK